MNTRVKGLLTLTIAAGGLLTALAFTPASAWADPPGGWGNGWGGRPVYNNGYNNVPVAYNNGNGGIFGRVFGNGNNNYNRPYYGQNNGWFRPNNCRMNNGWFGGNNYRANNGWFGQRHIAWGGGGSRFGYNHPYYQRRGGWW